MKWQNPQNPIGLLFGFLVGMVFAQTARAGQFEVVPSVGIGSAYHHDDRNGDDGDVSLSPNFSLRWVGPSGQIGVNYGATVRGDLDQGTWRADGSHRLGGSHQLTLTPRLRLGLSGDLTANPDTARIDSGDLDYGEIFTPGTDNLHWGGGAAVSYQSSPLRTNSLGFSYGQSRYDDDQLNDASWYGVTLSQSRQLASLASLQLSYRLDRSDLDDFSLHGMSLSYRRTWSQTLSTAFYAGFAYDPRHERRDFDPSYGWSGTKTFSQSSLSFSMGRSQGERAGWSRVDSANSRGTLSADPSADSGLSERGNLRGGGFFSTRTTAEYASLAGRLGLWKNWEWTWRGSANRTRSFDIQKNQITAYTADTGLRYQISGSWGANLSYQHLHQEMKNNRPLSGVGVPVSDAGSFDSDRVSASLSWHGNPWK
jgi:hypothetical protein